MWALSCRNPTAFSPFVLALPTAPHSAFRALHFSISCRRRVLLTLHVDSKPKLIHRANWDTQLVRRARAARPSAAAPAAKRRITATAAARRQTGRRTAMSASPRSRRTARQQRPTSRTPPARLMKLRRLEPPNRLGWRTKIADSDPLDADSDGRQRTLMDAAREKMDACHTQVFGYDFITTLDRDRN